MVPAAAEGRADAPISCAGSEPVWRRGHLGLDDYGEEGDLFFEDMSNKVLQDDVLARLATFPGVVITGHRAFFIREALQKIAEVTLCNLDAYEQHSLDKMALVI